jgi:hypothetical protein
MSSMYAVARQRMVTGSFNWPAGTWSAYLVTAAYVPNFETHAVLADVPSGTRMGGNRLTGPTAVGGICDADDVVIPSISGVPFAVVLVDATGSEEAYGLVAYIDDGFGVYGGSGPSALIWSTSGIFRP